MQQSLRRSDPSGLHGGATRSHVHPAHDVLSLVGPDLAEAEATLHEAMASSVPAVSEIGRYLAASGGKRLRPMLTVLGARAVGHRGPVARLACAGELVHLGSLLHDDVVDEGLERRGRPTAQRVYGNAGVILTGDYCVSRAMTLAAEEGGLACVTELARTVAAMSEGEVLQLLNAGNLALPVASYHLTIDKKSASLIAWCAAAGARALGRHEAARALAAYGREVGLAFQIADDVLDYVGKSAVTGKLRGRDLAQRKPTLPLLIALERRPQLRARVEAPALDEDAIAALVDEVNATGAPAACADQARAHVERAVKALDALPVSAEREALRALAWMLAERQA